MQKLKKQSDFLMNLIKKCEYHNLTEKQSLELINEKLSKPISRSTYYNYKKKLYSDKKFQSLKQSIYNSKLLKCILLYLDEADNPSDINIRNIILEKYPDKKDIFEIAEEQGDKIAQIHNRVQSNFCLRNSYSNNFCSNLTRVNQLLKNYTINEEYIRCGKQKTNKCKSCAHGFYYYAYWKEKLT